MSFPRSTVDHPTHHDPVLVLDTASPTVSLALAQDGRLLAERHLELRRTSEQLLIAVEEALEETGLALGDLAGMAALQGPGSFTGLRIGLATVLGWHQALGLPATALPTFPVLAADAWPTLAEQAGNSTVEVLAAVDAIRGDWSVQRFRLGATDPSPMGEGPPLPRVEPLDEPQLLSGEALLALAPEPPARLHLVGFGVDALAEGVDGIETIVPPPLAATAARLASLDLGLLGLEGWDPDRLIRPIYYRPPAVIPPKGR